jgi:hypothetical protein
MSADDGEVSMRIRAVPWLWSMACVGALSTHVGAGAEMAPDVHTAVQIELMKGHLIAAVANYERGQTALAQAHAAHPLHEHHRELPASFAKARPELDGQLREALAQLQRGLGGQLAAGTAAKQAEVATQLLDEAAALIPADRRNAPAFQAAVLTGLLEEIGEEYEAAVEDGEVVNLAEYQDAFAFLQRARVWLQRLAARLPSDDRQALQRLWAKLEDALPAVMPLSPAASPTAVEEHLRAIAAIVKRLS